MIRPPFPIPEEHMTPMLKLLRKLPRAEISTVVKTVLMLIQDESLNGKIRHTKKQSEIFGLTINFFLSLQARMFYALPNDVIKEQEMLPRQGKLCHY